MKFLNKRQILMLEKTRYLTPCIHVFLIYRMKCYFPNVWYYHTLKKQSKTISISEILHILLMSMEIPAPQNFSELLNSGNFVI